MSVSPEMQMLETKAAIVWSGDASHVFRPGAQTVQLTCALWLHRRVGQKQSCQAVQKYYHFLT